jgi:hypothetical protein
VQKYGPFRYRITDKCSSFTPVKVTIYFPTWIRFDRPGKKISHICSLSLFVEAQIRLVNYCCTLLYKSVLDEDRHRSRDMKMNHIIYAEKHGMMHSLSSCILTFLSIVQCRKEIGRFYRENEHFRELLNVMKGKYGGQSEFVDRDPSISYALDQMFDRHQRKKKRHYHQSHTNDENRKCSNSLCQMTENDVSHS